MTDPEHPSSLRPKPFVPSPCTPPRIPVRQLIKDSGRFSQYRGTVLLLLGALMIWMNLTFLVPVIMGTIFAVVLYPLMGKLQRYRIGVFGRSGLITLGFAVVFLFPLITIVFLGADAALSQIQRLQESGISAQKISPSGIIDELGIRPLVDRLADHTEMTRGQLRQLATRASATLGTWAVGFLQNLVANIPAAMFSTFIILITIFFLLIDGRRALGFVRDNSVFGKQQTERVFHVLTSLCYSVVVASIAAGGVQSMLIVLACIITGTSGALLIGLISFIASFLPIVGTAPITLFLTAQAFIHGEVFDAIVFLIFIFIVAISDNLVRPYVLKGGASLHPLIGFVAAFGALDAIGFYGVFIGPIVAGLFFTLLPIVTSTAGRPTRS